ncbi:MAG: hypothetical protein CR984_02405 [Proteobacteria bacterium]|nr:MAG: hypothetical protein CR984_02405 [Pseudomonadota bacterium]
MAARIEKTLGVVPTLIPKEGGIFDVCVGDKLVYSKFKTGTFPDEEQLVKDLASM